MTPGGPGSIDQIVVDKDGTHYLVELVSGGYHWYREGEVQDPAPATCGTGCQCQGEVASCPARNPAPAHFGWPDVGPEECATPVGHDGLTDAERLEQLEKALPRVSEHAARKARPLARGVLYYAPDALAAVAHLSMVGNDQHNPGQPLHWAKHKSTDHGDCILRHQADYDERDTDGEWHATKVAWRALMQLQTFLEARDPELAARRQAQRDRQARGDR